jgi:hypothetical protein
MKKALLDQYITIHRRFYYINYTVLYVFKRFIKKDLKARINRVYY